KDTIARMNEEIAKVQASSGMSIEVRWQRSDDATPAHRRALELLQAAPSRLTPSEQRELQEFIREPVRLAPREARRNQNTHPLPPAGPRPAPARRTPPAISKPAG